MFGNFASKKYMKTRLPFARPSSLYYNSILEHADIRSIAPITVA